MYLIFAVELWSNKMMPNPHLKSLQMEHYVETVHVATSEKAARKWALNNLEYGGTRSDHPGYFFPWHFRVRQWLTNEDVCRTVFSHNVYVGKEIHPRKYHKKKESLRIA